MAVTMPALLDEGDQTLEDRSPVLVEPHDEPRLHLEAARWIFLTFAIRSRFRFWNLLHSARLLLVRRFDAHEDLVEPRATMSAISSHRRQDCWTPRCTA